MVFEYINQHPQLLTMETHFRQGILFMRMGKRVKAKEILKLALADQKRFKQEWPESTVPYRIAGQVLTLLERKHEAEAEFLKAIEMDRGLLKGAKDPGAEARIRWSLGRTILALGDSEGAAEQLLTARALAPGPKTRRIIDQWIETNLRTGVLSEARGFSDVTDRRCRNDRLSTNIRV